MLCTIFRNHQHNFIYVTLTNENHLEDWTNVCYIYSNIDKKLLYNTRKIRKIITSNSTKTPIGLVSNSKFSMRPINSFLCNQLNGLNFDLDFYL